MFTFLLQGPSWQLFSCSNKKVTMLYLMLRVLVVTSSPSMYKQGLFLCPAQESGRAAITTLSIKLADESPFTDFLNFNIPTILKSCFSSTIRANASSFNISVLKSKISSTLAITHFCTTTLVLLLL